MLQGMTVRYLIRETYRVRKGDTILIHAAAGGVGLILCQWAKHLGATVIGTVGSRAKAKLARAHGCDHAIVYTEQNFTDRVRRITKGEGLPGGLRFHRQGHVRGLARLPPPTRRPW